jgi:hypothetical protein
MKKLLVMVMAVLAITACSDDDNVLNPTGGTDNGAAKYMAINIMSNSTDTRAESAETDPVFAAGTANEYAVDNILFYFFDAKGDAFDVNTVNGVDVNYKEPTFIGDETGTTDNITLTKSYVAIEPKLDNMPTQVVAVLNYKGIFTPERLSLADLKAKGLSTAESKIGDNTYLMMSNSVYLDAEGKEVYSTPITSDNLKDNQTDANANAVEIYVERVSAKVTTVYNIPEGNSVKTWGYSETDPNPIFPFILSHGDNNTDVKDIIVLGTDNKETSGLQVKILGYNLINKAGSTTLEKDITGHADYAALVKKVLDPENSSTSTDFSTYWNSATNHRSYWATTNLKTSTTEGETTTVSYNVTNDKLSYNGIGTSADAVYYPLENTLSSTDAMNTGLIFAAQILDKDGKAFPLVKMLSTYYTPEQAKEAIASYLSGQLYTTAYSDADGAAAQTELAATDFDIVAGDGYYATIKLNNQKDKEYAINCYDRGSSDTLTTEKIGEIIAKLPKIMYWKEGKCYYYTTITHLSKIFNIPGVVRNHWYELTVTNIVGLGTPVADPDEEVTPEHPTEEEWYLSTQINLLSWRKDAREIELK